MEQRLSLVYLGVLDLRISRNFYENLSWAASKSSSNDQSTFFQLGGIILRLYSLGVLAEEFNQVVGTGFGGMTLAHNARPKEQVDKLLIQAVTAGQLYSNWWKKFLGWLFRILL